jgi:hypothetical protein
MNHYRISFVLCTANLLLFLTFSHDRFAWLWAFSAIISVLFEILAEVKKNNKK